MHHRLPDVDAAAIRLAEPRALTQAIASWIYQQIGPTGVPIGGVHFDSRHGDRLDLRAVFERPGDGMLSPASPAYATTPSRSTTPTFRKHCASTDCNGPPDTRNNCRSARFGYPVQTSLEGVLVTDGESIEDQLNELRARIVEINELTQYNLLTGEALGLIRGMLIDLVEASDADPDDYIDDLDRLDQIANQFP